MSRGNSSRPGGRRLPREDTEPWYRQFWPWFLIALPGTVVIAALGTVFIAVRHADDLVVDDYYRTGLAINERLAREQKARELGIVARIQVFEQHLQLRLDGNDPGGPLRLRLSHPLEADRDFTLNLERSAPGLYLAEMPGPVAANWHWTLDSGKAGIWRLDGKLSTADLLDRPRG